MATLNLLQLPNSILKEYKNADIIIDIWGIIFSDSLGADPIVYTTLLISRLLNKPVIKYTADIGPFNTRWNRLFAKLYLNNRELIFARNEATREYLHELGLSSPIYLCPDTAFLLEPATSEKSEALLQEKRKGKAIIGIVVSHMISRRERDKGKYASLMAKIAGYLTQKLNAVVILIPNEVFLGRYDDLHVARRIYARTKAKDKVMMLTEGYPAEELKGIIGTCDLLIGARYHSIVAALSMSIPTLAVSWHHKYDAVMMLVGQEKYVCDVESLSFDKLRGMIDSLWENREEIRATIESRLPFVKESVLLCGEKVKQILDVRKSNKNPKMI